MTNTKKIANLGVAWEQAFGYAQAVQVKDTIYISGQLSHDGDGNLVAPAILDDKGRPVDFTQMEEQIRHTYVNAKKLLAEFGATLDDVVEETLLFSTFRAHLQPDQRFARRCTAQTRRRLQAT